MDLEPGTPVVILWDEEGVSSQLPGRIATQAGRAVDLDFDMHVPPLPPFVFAIAGERPARYKARASVRSRQDQSLAISLREPWQPWDPRRAPRHPCSFDAIVRTSDGWEARVRMRDLSVLGIGFEVAEVPPRPNFVVELDGAMRLTLACKVTRVFLTEEGELAIGAVFDHPGEYSQLLLGAVVKALAFDPELRRPPVRRLAS
ncbi:MAG: PilZ domain-containing protein [Gemmataceae bacterium]|nr:PilZ domain-containing protein [Gemmataceae bacterium]